MLTKNCTEQVLREKEVMKFGHNPFIASLFCTFSSQNSLFLVMEYAPGGDLATLLKNLGRLSERAVGATFLIHSICFKTWNRPEDILLRLFLLLSISTNSPLCTVT